MLKRTVSSRRFFWVPARYILRKLIYNYTHYFILTIGLQNCGSVSFYFILTIELQNCGSVSFNFILTIELQTVVQYPFTLFWPLNYKLWFSILLLYFDHWTTNCGSVSFYFILTIELQNCGSESFNFILNIELQTVVQYLFTLVWPLNYKLWLSILLLYFDHWFIWLETLVQYTF